MCEKIFGQKYKWNEQKHDYEPYSRTDMWNKMIEQQDKISDLEAKLAEKEKEIEYQESMKILAVENQNKKAIEQLEKVKENIHYLLSFDYNLLGKVNEQFDNQIKQLKEGM